MDYLWSNFPQKVPRMGDERISSLAMMINADDTLDVCVPTANDIVLLNAVTFYQKQLFIR